MQNLSDILPLFCTPTWPSHHVSENQEYVYIDAYFCLAEFGLRPSYGLKISTS